MANVPGTCGNCLELRRRILKTAAIRFVTARRLTLHHRLSQWVVTLASATLVAIPLVQPLAALTPRQAALMNTVQVLLAVLVLTYSLLLTQENFAVRAERMHSSSILLNALGLEMTLHLTECSMAEGMDYLRRYEALLTRSENHAELDHLWHKLRQREYVGLREYLRLSRSVALTISANFLHYFFIAVLLASVLAWLFLLAI